MNSSVKKIVTIVVTIVVVGIAWSVWKATVNNGELEDLVSGNGRIEATEIDIATKFAGRVVELFVREGDYLEAGQVVAQMQSDLLEAQLAQADAQYQEAVHGVAAARAQVAVRESDVAAAEAVVVKRESELINQQRRLART